MQDNDEIEVMDQHGNRKRITRGEYARHTLDAARQQWWDNLDAMRHFTVQFLQEGFPAQSLEVAERAIELSNGNVRDLYFRAVAQGESGQIEAAAANFEELREDAAYPADIARAAAGLARMRARQGKAEEAEQLFHEAIDTDPDNHGAMVELFAFLGSLGRQQSAVEKIQGMMQKYPRASAPHRALAHISAMTGNKDGIRTAVREAVSRATPQELNEVVAEATTLLGQSGQASEIIQLLEPRRSEINHPVALLNLAQAYAEGGRIPEARQLLQQMLPSAPPQFRGAVQQRLEQLGGQ